MTRVMGPSAPSAAVHVQPSLPANLLQHKQLDLVLSSCVYHYLHLHLAQLDLFCLDLLLPVLQDVSLQHASKHVQAVMVRVRAAVPAHIMEVWILCMASACLQIAVLPALAASKTLEQSAHTNGMHGLVCAAWSVMGEPSCLYRCSVEHSTQYMGTHCTTMCRVRLCESDAHYHVAMRA